MTPQEFIEMYTNKAIDYDGYYGNQCFDVANQYIDDITGFRPLITLLNASDIYKRPEGIIPPGAKYERIENTPDAIPQVGDIIVWESKPWNGGFGHVAIVQAADIDNLTVLQQDGFRPTEPAKIKKWNYNDVLGWLRVSPSDIDQNHVSTDFYEWEVDTLDKGISYVLLRAGQLYNILDLYDYESEDAWQHLAEINGYDRWQDLNTKIANSGGFMVNVWERDVPVITAPTPPVPPPVVTPPATPEPAPVQPPVEPIPPIVVTPPVSPGEPPVVAPTIPPIVEPVVTQPEPLPTPAKPTTPWDITYTLPSPYDRISLEKAGKGLFELQIPQAALVIALAYQFIPQVKLIFGSDPQLAASNINYFIGIMFVVVVPLLMHVYGIILKIIKRVQANKGK